MSSEVTQTQKVLGSDQRQPGHKRPDRAQPPAPTAEESSGSDRVTISAEARELWGSQGGDPGSGT